MITKDWLRQNTGFLGLIYLALAIPFQDVLTPYPAFGLILIQILLSRKQTKASWTLFSFLPIGLFLISFALSFPLSESSIKTVQKLIPLVLTATMLPFLRFSAKQIKQVWLGFSLALVLNFYLSIALGIPHYLETGDSTQFFYMKLCVFLERQPHYLALFSACAIMFTSVKNLPQLNAYPARKKLGIGFLLLSLLAFLMMLSARAQIFAFAFVAFCAVLLHFHFQGNTKKGILIAILALSGFSLAVLSSPKARERLANSFERADITIDETGKEDPRIITWQTAFELITEKPLLGHGTGEANEILQKRAAEDGHLILKKKKLNYHNQYLQVWAANGILGLILLLSFLAYWFHLLWQSKQWYQLAAVCLFALSMLTESMLQRQAGVIFLCFLMFSTILDSKSALPDEK